MVINQYPHYCYYYDSLSSEPDENGSYHPTEGDWYFYSLCRAEGGVKGGTARGTDLDCVDGNMVQNKGTVYFPKRNYDLLPLGVPVIITREKMDNPHDLTTDHDRLKRDMTIVWEGTNQTFESNQLNCRMFI